MSLLVQTMLLTLTSLTGIMILLWLVSLARRDASIVDPFWGMGFVIVAWLAVMRSGLTDTRSLLLVGLVTIWGTRLSLFLLWRNWGHKEDRRYAAMRVHHGSRFAWVSLATVFLLQGVILWFVSMPIQVVIASSVPSIFRWYDGISLALWTIGLALETCGDWQLARFKADPQNAGRVMDQGLWRFTRHPNYFGDFCIWWGHYLLAVPGGAWWTVGSPILMSILLMKVSGVTLLESTIIDRRPEYAAYQTRTSAFFPWRPKRTDVAAADSH